MASLAPGMALIFVALIVPLAHSEPAQTRLLASPVVQPVQFWKQKPALKKKIYEERAIVVSVNEEKVSQEKVRFHMSGAGLVARPMEHCFRLSQAYPRLKEVSGHFRTVTFDKSKNQLFLITEALGYQARMILKMKPVRESMRSEIQWEVIWGHFKGMKGVIAFEKVGPLKTEVSILADYEAKELPLPKVLMGFALEVVTQKVAEKMRAFLENPPSETERAPVAAEPSLTSF